MGIAVITTRTIAMGVIAALALAGCSPRNPEFSEIGVAEDALGAPGHNRVSRYTGDRTSSLRTLLKSTVATVETYAAAGQAAGFSHAGLQWGGKCWAGNTVGYSTASNSECNMPGKSNSAEMCCGSPRNSICGPQAGATPAPTPTSTQSPAPSPWAIAGTRRLYVSTSGSDSNPGASDRPFRTVSHAASVATAGAVVHVAPGTYGYVSSSKSGTSRAPITFVSDTKWGAKINAPGQTNAWTNTGDWVVIQGFEITGSNYSGIMSTASHGRFRGNHIHHMAPPNCSRGGAGIELQSYSGQDNDSDGNVIHDINGGAGCGLIHGIYYSSPNGGRILNNIVYKISGWGIHLWHNANNILIANNTVFQNGHSGMVIGGSLEGNDQSPGIDSGTVVINNIVVDNADCGIEEMGRVGVNTYANNQLYHNRRGAYSLKGGGQPTSTLTTDPQFVNYQPDGSGNYRLRPGSPAVNSGSATVAPAYDMNLAARPKGSAVDRGVYEDW